MPDRFPLPIDVAVPDPVPARDPWPYHLCMPSVDWPEPPGPVLRPDRAAPVPACRRSAWDPRFWGYLPQLAASLLAGASLGSLIAFLVNLPKP